MLRAFVSRAEEKAIATAVDESPGWVRNRDRQNSRRILVYGRETDSSYEVREEFDAVPLPGYAQTLCGRLNELMQGVADEFPTYEPCLGQDELTGLLVNEYPRSGGLRFHSDNRSTYHDIIYGVSLLADARLTWRLGGKEETVLIPRRSLYLMTGASRYSPFGARRKAPWQHGMHPGGVLGKRRISLTFRTVRRILPSEN